MKGARVLVVDDQPLNQRLMQALLDGEGHVLVLSGSGTDALAQAFATPPDLVLLDVLMPDIDGFEVCRRFRADPRTRAVPVLMVTTLDRREDRVRGLDAGADDFISKPVQSAELRARVRSLLRGKALYDEVLQLSATLEARVAEQVRQMERLSQLKRFLPPRLAEQLVADGAQALLHSHRREVTVLFADLRGFTAFAERHPPDHVMQVLQDFHSPMGELAFSHGGTLERYTGDGMMVFFNDPDPVEQHALHAVRLALAMRDRGAVLAAAWRAGDGPDGVGFGLAKGVATVGAIGFAGRMDYAAIGSVTNRAARLCSVAGPGEILVCGAVWADVEPHVHGSPVAGFSLKGLPAPAEAWGVTSVRAAPSAA